MSTIKSSSENLTLNADGSGNDIKFQSNGVEKASLTDGGVFTATSFAGSGANLTGVTDATKLPLAGGTLTGTLNITNNLPILKFTDSNSGGYNSSVHQEGSSFKIFSDEGNVGAGQIRLYVSASEKVRILANGKVGINTTNPLAMLHSTQNGIPSGFSIDGGANEFLISDSGSEVGMTIASTGVGTINFADGGDARIGRIRYTHSSNSLEFWANNAERLRLDNAGNLKVNTGNLVIGTAGKGIDFSVNSHPSGMTSELLNDYEEGTWTPQLHDVNNNLATMHSLTGGQYTKIGRQVTVTGNIRTTSVSGLSGALYISGLPANSASGNGFNASGSVANAENVNITASESLTIYMGQASSKLRIDIYDSAQGITPMTTGQWSSDGQMAITVTYFA